VTQCEDGYTRIANELFEAILRFNFSKRELNIMLAVIRKTYGYNKKSDEISLSQLANLTGIKRNHVSETITDLTVKKVFLKQDGNHANRLTLNKNYKSWGVPETGTVPKTGTGCSQNRTNPVPKTGTTKDNYTKDNSKRKESVKIDPFLKWPDKPNPEQWEEIMKARKTKKAVNSQRAFNIIGGQLQKAVDAGHNFHDCITMWEQKQWKGFEFEWYANQRKSNGTHRQTDKPRSAADRIRIANEAIINAN